MSVQAVGGLCADTLVWRAPQCGQVALCTSVTVSRSSIRTPPCLSAEAWPLGTVDPLLSPPLLKTFLIKKNGSASNPPAFHTLWVAAAVTCHPGHAWPPTVPLSPAHATLPLRSWPSTGCHLLGSGGGVQVHPHSQVSVLSKQMSETLPLAQNLSWSFSAPYG